MIRLKLTLVWLGQLFLDLRFQVGVDLIGWMFTLLPGLRRA
jgi:hypothetical protein